MVGRSRPNSTTSWASAASSNARTPTTRRTSPANSCTTGIASNTLKFASGPPRISIGQEPGKALLSYRCKGTVVKGGSVLLQANDRHSAQGFSGGPIVNFEGKVVGTMLAGDPEGTSRQGATVGNIRERIAGR